MIRWMSIVRLSAGKGVPAMQWAKEMVEFAKKYEGAPPVHVFLDSFGDMGTIRFYADYDDLVAFELVSNQLVADEDYWKKIEEAKDLFIDGSNHTVVMREI